MLTILVCSIAFAGQAMWAQPTIGTEYYGTVTSCQTGVGPAPPGACACPVKRGVLPSICEAYLLQSDAVTQVGCQASYPFTVQSSAIRWKRVR